MRPSDQPPRKGGTRGAARRRAPRWLGVPAPRADATPSPARASTPTPCSPRRREARGATADTSSPHPPREIPPTKTTLRAHPSPVRASVPRPPVPTSRIFARSDFRHPPPPRTATVARGVTPTTLPRASSPLSSSAPRLDFRRLPSVSLGKARRPRRPPRWWNPSRDPPRVPSPPRRAARRRRRLSHPLRGARRPDTPPAAERASARPPTQRPAFAPRTRSARGVPRTRHHGYEDDRSRERGGGDAREGTRSSLDDARSRINETRWRSWRRRGSSPPAARQSRGGTLAGGTTRARIEERDGRRAVRVRDAREDDSSRSSRAKWLRESGWAARMKKGRRRDGAAAFLEFGH